MEELKLIIDALNNAGAAAQPLFYTWIGLRLIDYLLIAGLFFYAIRCAYFLINKKFYTDEIKKYAREAASIDRLIEWNSGIYKATEEIVKEARLSIEMLKNLDDNTRNRVIQRRIDEEISRHHEAAKVEKES